jgi:hypothetical protein
VLLIGSLAPILGGVIPLWKLRIESPNRCQGVRYQATDPDFVRKAIESLSIPRECYAYVDLGSGKVERSWLRQSIRSAA